MPLSEYVQANLAQAFVNVLFGSASVINMIGLQNFDPVVYGLIRAVLTTILLVSLRWDQRLVCCSSNRVQQDDVARFCAAAICLFVGCVLSPYPPREHLVTRIAYLGKSSTFWETSWLARSGRRCGNRLSPSGRWRSRRCWAMSE